MIERALSAACRRLGYRLLAEGRAEELERTSAAYSLLTESHAQTACEREGYKRAYELTSAERDGYRRAFELTSAEREGYKQAHELTSAEREGYRRAYEQTATELTWCRARLDGWRRHPWPQVGFMHLLKTGGTSLTRLLAGAFADDRVFWGWSAEHFDPLTPEALEPFDLVCGHFCHGHTRHFRPHRALISFVREPVDRVLSTYWYFRTADLEPREHIRGVVACARRFCLLDFLRAEEPQVWAFTRDHQTYGFASDWRRERRGGRGAEVLAAALAHLDDFLLVGVTERLEEGVQALCRLLHWRPPPPPGRLNVTPSRQLAAEITARERDAILEHNQLDLALYAQVLRRFDEVVGRAGVSPLAGGFAS